MRDDAEGCKELPTDSSQAAHSVALRGLQCSEVRTEG
jgi:hypothetical protein